MAVLRTSGHLRALVVSGKILASPGNESTTPKGTNRCIPRTKKKTKKERTTMIMVIVSLLFVLALTVQ